MIVAPAAIRDAQVWQTEIKKVGFDAPYQVISYHQLAKFLAGGGADQYDAVIFDEAHWLKNRKVSWGDPAVELVKRMDRVYLGSGTPTPNDASELWGQLRLVHDMPAFWTWADASKGGWFDVTSNTYSDYNITGVLRACYDARCVNAIDVVADCEHWAEFRAKEQAPYMLARPEELLDLPEMSGQDTPLWSPMKPAQARLYKELKKDFLASIPEEGIYLEALSDSQKFAHLWMLASGLSCLDPDQDTQDKHSGKLALLGELLEDRKNPALVATYFKNSALAVGRICRRMGYRHAFFGASTTPAARRAAVEQFQAGELDVLIGSIAVVGEGLTLTAADSVMLFERMWTPDKNAQVIRRVRRRGQTKAVGVRQLITPDSVDEGQWGALKRKFTRISRTEVSQILNGTLGRAA